VEDNDVRAASANILQSRRIVFFAVPIGLPRIADDPTYAPDPERVEFGDLTIEYPDIPALNPAGREQVMITRHTDNPPECPRECIPHRRWVA